MLKRIAFWILAFVLMALAGTGLGRLTADLMPSPIATATASFEPMCSMPAPTPPPSFTRPQLPAGAPWVPLVRFTNVGVTDVSVAAAVKAINALNAAGADYIVLEISSPGGSVDEGMELSRSIEMSTVPVHCVVDGQAQSMATYILQSCDKRSMTQRSILMIHEPAIAHEGWQRYTDTKNQESYARHFTAAFLQQYKRLKVPMSQIKKSVEHGQNWYLSSDEALEVGAVDSIVDSVEAVRKAYRHARKK